MAHWAEINNQNKVIRVTVGSNDESDEGYQWLIENLGGTWIKTSYNAHGGKRRNPETNESIDEPGFRKNFAGVDFYYDSEKDAFIPPKPELNLLRQDGSEIPGQWVLNEETCLWDFTPEE
jgi:hypothetical protein